MFIHREDSTVGPTAGSNRRHGAHRLRMAVAALTAALALSACGGGGYVDSAGNFSIGVTLDGRFVSDTPVVSGGSLDLAIHAGQSVIFDAREAVVWTMFVGGSAISGGAQVYYAGLDILATTLNPSTVAVDTHAAFALQAPIDMTLVATSTYDSAQVATVHLLITN